MRPAMDFVLFVIFPYAALVVCVIGSIERYRRHGVSVTSLSSQFLENRRHFWGAMPFHLGLLAVLAAHVVWFAVPGQVIRWNQDVTRLYLTEVVMLACGLLALFGSLALGRRRAADTRLRRMTSGWDWIVLSVLLAQIATGVLVAVRYTWGSTWFAAVAAPYLWSLVRLNPDMAAVAALPVLARAHIIGAYVLVAVFPFSRLVHILAVPNPYLWRPPQLVRWHPPVEAPTGGPR
jgi:nitrate reductase gamma subunit